MMRLVGLLGLIAIVLAGGVIFIFGWSGDDAVDGSGPIIVPQLTQMGTAGRGVFAENCAVCHGAVGGGTEQGPPLIHRIYEPSHHADMAFQMAVRNGVRAHHWRFGNMPPITGVGPQQVAAATAFVREMQRANGIH